MPYVRQLADMLRLRDWRVEVSEEGPGASDAIASCAPVQGRKYAVIRLAESFLTDPPADQRHTLTHELLHCHFGPFCRAIESVDAMSAPISLAMEYCVDGLADAIAPLLPMPPASTRSQH